MAILSLNKICAVCANIKIGTKLAAMKAKIDADTAYDGDVLTADEISAFNHMCKKAQKISAGTVINDVLTAAKNLTPITVLDDATETAFNRICAATVKEELGGFLQTAITKINTLVETEKPILLAADTSDDGAIITLAFDEVIDPTGLVAADYVVEVGGVANVIANLVRDISDNTRVIATLTTTIEYGDVVTVSYTKGTTKATNGKFLDSFVDEEVTNNVPAPLELVSAATDELGTIVTLTMNKDVDETSLDVDDYAVKVNGTPVTISTIALDLVNADEIDLTVPAILNTDIVLVSYTAGTTVAKDDGVLKTFADEPVTNNVPAGGE